jgi:hypothetical protein
MRVRLLFCRAKTVMWRCRSAVTSALSQMQQVQLARAAAVQTAASPAAAAAGPHGWSACSSRSADRPGAAPVVAVPKLSLNCSDTNCSTLGLPAAPCSRTHREAQKTLSKHRPTPLLCTGQSPDADEGLSYALQWTVWAGGCECARGFKSASARLAHVAADRLINSTAVCQQHAMSWLHDMLLA